MHVEKWTLKSVYNICLFFSILQIQLKNIQSRTFQIQNSKVVQF